MKETKFSFAGTTVSAGGGKLDDIVVLCTNDVHTYINKELSYDVIAQLKKELQENYKHVILVDAGDHAQGTAYGSMDKGETIIQLMNAAGYDLATHDRRQDSYRQRRQQRIIDTDWRIF